MFEVSLLMAVNAFFAPSLIVVNSMLIDNDNTKIGLSPTQRIFYFNESSLKFVKNAFYLIAKAFFILEISKFLSWLFCLVEKMASLGR